MLRVGELRRATLFALFFNCGGAAQLLIPIERDHETQIDRRRTTCLLTEAMSMPTMASIPAIFSKRRTVLAAHGRKARRALRQIAETLSQVFGESGDAIVQSLQVVETKPAPDASQLLVLGRPCRRRLI